MSATSSPGTVVTEQIVLGGGCFWCLDAAYRQLKGIISSVCGYAGGYTERPTYDELHRHDTGHAEVVQLTFDPVAISLATILDVFWAIHDPTTPNRQGNDIGAEYRSIILYQNEAQLPVIQDSLQKAAGLWPAPIITKVVPLPVFYPAEAEHQNFFAKHPESAYCQVVINPKLHKLQQKFASLLS